MGAWPEGAVTTDDVLNGVEELLEEHTTAVKSIIVASTTDADFIGATVTATYRWLSFTGAIDENGEVRIEVPYVGTYSLQATANGKTLKGYSQVLSIGGIYDGSLTGDVLFAFHYSESDSDPDSVDYPAGYDNSSWDDPAYMDFNTNKFHYGDWDPEGDHKEMLKWLFPKSCMLAFSGAVSKYLDENDETKNADGTPSAVANMAATANAMMEWGQDGKKIYWKIVPDNDNLGFTFVVGNYQADADMKAWNHYDADGNLSDHFYTPKYFGSLDSNNKLRSISGQSNSVSTTRTQEVTYARNNNQNGKIEWDTETYADWLLVGLLTCLISKNLNSQAKFGCGRGGISNAGSAINTGTMDGKGMFWGDQQNVNGVKVWGMENPWGNIWRAIRGYINNNGTLMIKLTKTTIDGSSASDYNENGSGYINAGAAQGAHGSISSMRVVNKRGLVADAGAGAGTTYYCDYMYVNNAQVDYAFVGGDWSYAAACGVFCTYLRDLASDTRTDIGAALSCKPLAS